MPTVLVTGSAGFFGGLLATKLAEQGDECVGFDIRPHEISHPNLTPVTADLRDRAALDRVLAEHRVDVVYHCAAMLAHDRQDARELWTSNVDGTRNLAEAVVANGVRKVVFVSTNCLWGRGFGRPVTEDDPPEPVEIYGRSKAEGEQILRAYADRSETVIIRTPTIIDAGRLGLLAILFEFIDEGRRVWLVGRGENRYQFVHAGDLISACELAARHPGSATFNVGSDNVKSLADVYRYVIARAGTGARVASLPKGPAIAAMRVAHLLHVSPLGPYHHKMIAEDFVFDTTRAKAALGWQPTLTNEETLWRAYEHYHAHRDEIRLRGTEASAHRKAASMGVIRLLKWLS